MTFNESNTVEALLRDRLAAIGWEFMDHATLPRQSQDVCVEDHLRDALFRLNPTIAERPERADEVLYRLRAAIMTVRDTGLVKANEEFAAWLLGERSMPFGESGEHVTIRLIDFEEQKQNQLVVTQQFTCRAGRTEKRADLVLLVNGMPLVVIEAKTPVRSSESWLDGAIQVHDDYERNVPELFVPNIFSVATEGKELRYGSVRMPIDKWGPWRPEDDDALPGLQELERAVASMLRPNVVLDLLESFTAYATHRGKQRIKLVARYQQVDGVNRIVNRVVAGQPRKGLLWHFQGSGKSLLMLFAARKLRLHPALRNPTILVVVDRIDLDTQISATFHAAGVPNLERTAARGVELACLVASRHIGELANEVLVGVTEHVRADGGVAQRDRREALDEVLEQFVGELLAVAPVGCAEDAVERVRIRPLDLPHCSCECSADIGRRLANVPPVAAFGNVKAVDLRKQ